MVGVGGYSFETFPKWCPSVQSVPSLTEGMLWEAGPGLREPELPPGAPAVVAAVAMLAAAATAACKGREE